MRIFRQEYLITSPFDEKMAFEGLRSQLSSRIFWELVNEEKGGIKLVFTLEVLETEHDLPK